MDYRPELDGIRAVALMAVVGFHAYVQLAQGGWLGVDIFFVLSGFLITQILLTEQRRTGAVRLGRFYLRRLLRLYPALLVALVLGAGFYGVLGDGGARIGPTGTVTVTGDASVLDYLRTAGAAAGYVENFVYAYGNTALGFFGHTWSLAVEMQFYLVWPPLVVLLLSRGRNLLPWILVGIAVSYLLMVLQSTPEHLALPNAYYLPWGRAWELLVGALVAVLAARPGWQPGLLARRWAGWVVVAGLGVVILVASTYSILLVDYVLLWEAPIAVALTALLLVHLNAVGTTGAGAVLAWSPLVWIGKLSYGIYLIHYPVLWVLRDRGLTSTDHATITFAAAMAISTVLAAGSYYLVEQPALRLKRRFEPVS